MNLERVFSKLLYWDMTENTRYLTKGDLSYCQDREDIQLLALNTIMLFSSDRGFLCKPGQGKRAFSFEVLPVMVNLR